jgi:hypothetical protein
MSFEDIRLFGLSPTEILFLKEFYVAQTGDTDLSKLRSRTIEKALRG